MLEKIMYFLGAFAGYLIAFALMTFIGVLRVIRLTRNEFRSTFFKQNT